MRFERPSPVPALAVALAALIGTAASPRDARAGAFVTPPNTAVHEREARMLLICDGKKETVIEELEVVSTAADSIWLTAYPSKPQTTRAIQPALMDELETLTEVKEPYNEALRRTLFGPSVVTLLTKKLADPVRPKPEPTDRGELRKLEIKDSFTFSGHVITSTITQRPQLPDELVALTAHFGGLDIGEELEVATYLNRDWVVVASVVHDPRPRDPRPARLGPILIELRTEVPILPVGFADLEEPAKVHLFIVGREPLAPIGFNLDWEQRPWQSQEQSRQSKTLYVSYSRPIDRDLALDFELREKSELPIPQGANIQRAEMVLNQGKTLDLELTSARDAIELPPPGGRGSAVDLIVCVLLGLTPLLYTPESWFFLWLGARARERKRGRRDPAPFSARLWSLYALGVGVYWFLTLPQGARVAAIAPALVGLVQLALPYVDRDQAPIRVQFKRKKNQPKS